MIDKPPIRVLIVDDHQLMRAGIAGEIDSETDMTVVGQAVDGEEALVMFRLHRPDVTLMDIRMPGTDGINAISKIRMEFSRARIVVLTTFGGDVQALRAFKAGAVGYLQKDLLRHELLDTIRSVHIGQRRIPPAVAAEMAQHATDEWITPRELEVLASVAEGSSNKSIASSLVISEHTVKNHLKNILSKLNASDRTHAVTIALKRGFFHL